MAWHRDAVIAEARRWVGTPYRHRAALIGIGCDCLGLILGVRHALAQGAGDVAMPRYGFDWASVGKGELLLEGCEGRLLRTLGREEPGDVLLFRWRAGRPASHLAFAADAGRMIHAHVRACVAEVPLGPAWRRRVAAIYRFPEIV
jgi:NlpC/P60 family putative phage cell wall peptidase